MRYPRKQDLKHDAAARSMFLFGPRQTGKTSLLRNQFPNALYFNLLQADTFLRLSGNPGLLRERIDAQFYRTRWSAGCSNPFAKP